MTEFIELTAIDGFAIAVRHSTIEAMRDTLAAPAMDANGGASNLEEFADAHDEDEASPPPESAHETLLFSAQGSYQVKESCAEVMALIEAANCRIDQNMIADMRILARFIKTAIEVGHARPEYVAGGDVGATVVFGAWRTRTEIVQNVMKIIERWFPKNTWSPLR